MRNFLNTLMITAISILVSMSAQADSPAKPTSSIFAVNGMVCAFCAQGIEKKLLEIPQIKAVYIDLETKVVVVEAKEASTLDIALITTEIKDAGYDVIKVETVASSVADFRKAIESKK
jgi:copper chaperone CopZ